MCITYTRPMGMFLPFDPVLTRHRLGHRRRVSVLAVDLGRAIRLRESVLGKLRLAAWAHDIGKRGIPAGLLGRPGRLTPEEICLVRQHVVIGTAIARRKGFPRAVILGIRHHHEQWDGTGYPDGLAGRAIPLFSRIIAIADAYDVMTTGRPYQRAVSAEAALVELTRYAGTQFDPELTRVFANCLFTVHTLWRSRGA